MKGTGTMDNDLAVLQRAIYKIVHELLERDITRVDALAELEAAAVVYADAKELEVRNELSDAE